MYSYDRTCLKSSQVSRCDECWGQSVKVTLSSSKATTDRDNEQDVAVHLPSFYQASTSPLPRSPSNPPTVPPLPNPTPMLPRDSLLWNATHGEESRSRRSVCHTCLKEGGRDGERVTGEASHPSKTRTGPCFSVGLCVGETAKWKKRWCHHLRCTSNISYSSPCDGKISIRSPLMLY